MKNLNLLSKLATPTWIRTVDYLEHPQPLSCCHDCWLGKHYMYGFPLACVRFSGTRTRVSEAGPTSCKAVRHVEPLGADAQVRVRSRHFRQNRTPSTAAGQSREVAAVHHGLPVSLGVGSLRVMLVPHVPTSPPTPC